MSGSRMSRKWVKRSLIIKDTPTCQGGFLYLLQEMLIEYKKFDKGYRRLRSKVEKRNRVGL